MSPAAVTKAIKKLQNQALVMPSRIESDERVVFWRLTEKGNPIAQEHKTHHAKTLATYKKITENFNSQEQKTIQEFLSALTEVFQ